MSKVIHFIFKTSKTVERRKEQNYLLRCKSKFNYNKIFNLLKVTKKLSTIRFKKLEQRKCLHPILRPRDTVAA